MKRYIIEASTDGKRWIEIYTSPDLPFTPPPGSLLPRVILNVEQWKCIRFSVVED